jgi:hypothetical protein
MTCTPLHSSYSSRRCEFYDMTDQDETFGGAPCEEMDEEDVFGPEEPDPDAQRDAAQDRAMREAWGE